MSWEDYNEYGVIPLYKRGDVVRVWPIFKNPIGTIDEVVDPNAFPIKYRVTYTYHTGYVYSEEFEQQDLTLIERRLNFYCNCETVTDKHASWCNRYNGYRR